MKYCNYIENLIQSEYNKTGKYPIFLKLSKEIIDKMYKELIETDILNGWFDNWPENYRGIPIKIIKIKKENKNG